MIYNCGFDFHVLICHLHIVFSEMSFHTICLFSPWIVSFLMLSFQSSFYILYANSWLAMWLTNIFSYSVVYRLILLTRSSIEQTFFILLKSRLSFFFLLWSCFGVIRYFLLGNNHSFSHWPRKIVQTLVFAFLFFQ